MAMLFERLRQDLPIIGLSTGLSKISLADKRVRPTRPLKLFQSCWHIKQISKSPSNISYFRSGEEQAIDIKTKPANPEYKLNHGGDQRVGKIGVSAHRCAMKR